MADSDLLLVERALDRICAANNEQALELTLHKFLPAVLRKFDSGSPAVKQKIMELLAYVNKRLTNNKRMKIPIVDILNLYSESSNMFVTNFCMYYQRLGYHRCDRDTKLILFRQYLLVMKNRPFNQQCEFMQMAALSLPELRLANTSENPIEILHSLYDDPEVSKLFYRYMVSICLLPYSTCRTEKLPPPPPGKSSDAPKPADTEYSGICQAELMSLTGTNGFTEIELREVKISIIILMSKGVYNLPESIFALICASTDGIDQVSQKADNTLKQIASKDDWDDVNIPMNIYNLFLGTSINKSAVPVLPAKLHRPAANLAIRLKIIPHLLRSESSANCFPQTIQLICEGLNGQTTNSRLRLQIMKFVIHVDKYCSQKNFPLTGKVMLAAVTSISFNNEYDDSIRTLAFSAIGLIGLREPRLINKDTSLLFNLVQLIEKMPSNNIKQAVVDTVNMIAKCYAEDETEGYESIRYTDLQRFISMNLKSEIVATRRIAIHYAALIFPSDHIPTRYLLLLATGDRAEEIFTDAIKVLSTFNIDRKRIDCFNNPSGVRDNSPKAKVPRMQQRRLMPKFVEMVDFITEKVESHKISYKDKGALSPVAFSQMLIYLRKCMAYEAGIEPDESSLVSLRGQAGYLKKWILSHHDNLEVPLERYSALVKRVVNVSGGAPSMYCMLEAVCMSRETRNDPLFTEVEWLKKYISDTSEEMRQLAAECYAITLIDTSNVVSILDGLKGFTENTKQKEYELVNGSILTIGFIVSNIVRTCKPVCELNIEQPMLIDAVQNIVNILFRKENTHFNVATLAIGEIGRSGRIPLEGGDVNGVKKLVDYLIGQAADTKLDIKRREHSVRCLGMICLGDDKFEYRKHIIESLLKTPGPKQVDFHTTVGKALAYCALSTTSIIHQDEWSVVKEDFKLEENGTGENVKLIIGDLQKMVKHQNPHYRQAACIWLLEMCEQCSHYVCLQESIFSIQLCFLTLLKEKDETLQELASRGLSVVYDSSNDADRTVLVANLTELLLGKASGGRTAGNVQPDTKIFDEGDLGKTPDGSNISTYRDLCSIASDLNQPELVYKFMNLAQHQTVWNSKKGAALGFQIIAKQAGKQLEPQMDIIIPKLYRYQFDPNPRIQKAMSCVWSSLVTDEALALNRYMQPIMVDIKVNLESVDWRVRESTCLALADFIRNKDIVNVVESFPELWLSVLRVLDDVKETVRLAALKSIKALSKATVRLCDIARGAGSVETIQIMLPLLCNTALKTMHNDSRTICFSTIVKISNIAGEQLRPHITVMVPILLEAMDVSESSFANYLSLHASAADDSAGLEQLDNMRVTAAKTFPIMGVINKCITYANTDNIEALVSGILSQMKSSIGISGKTSAARVLVMISIEHSTLMQDQAGKCLKALLSGLMNSRSIVLKKSFATTIGFISKVSRSSSQQKVFIKMNQRYFEATCNEERDAIGYVMEAMNRHAHDAVLANQGLVLPLSYFAMHRIVEDKHFDPLWETVWQDAIPGSEYASLRTYFEEITELCLGQLKTSPDWTIKSQAARTIGHCIDTIASNTLEGSALKIDKLEFIYDELVVELSGHFWKGKERVIQAVATILVQCKNDTKEWKKAKLIKAVSLMCTAAFAKLENNRSLYHVQALKCLMTIVQVHKLDMFQLLYDPLFNYVDREDSEKMDHSEQKNLLDFLRVSYESIGLIFMLSASQNKEKHLSIFIDKLKKKLTNLSWKLQGNCMSSVKIIVKSTQTTIMKKELMSTLCKVLPELNTIISSSKQDKLIQSAIEIISVLNDLSKEYDYITEFREAELEIIETLEKLTIKNSDCPKIKEILKVLKKK